MDHILIIYIFILHYLLQILPQLLLSFILFHIPFFPFLPLLSVKPPLFLYVPRSGATALHHFMTPWWHARPVHRVLFNTNVWGVGKIFLQFRNYFYSILRTFLKKKKTFPQGSIWFLD